MSTSILRVRLEDGTRKSWKIRGLRNIILLLFFLYHFLNTKRKWSVEQDDCVRSGLIELQSSLVSKYQVAPIHCIFDELAIHFSQLQFELFPSYIAPFLEIDARPSGSRL